MNRRPAGSRLAAPIGMRTWQAVGLLAIVLLLVILVVVFVTPVRTETPPTQSPVTRPSPSASTAPPSTTAPTTAARSSTPSPTPTGLYVNETWKFSVVLPTPYRRSSRLSLENTGGQRPAAQDAFTPRTDQDEAALSAQSCQTACPVWDFVAVR